MSEWTVWDYVEYIATGGVYNESIKHEYIDDVLKYIYFKIQEINSLNASQNKY